jgi:hypothetical protein
MLYWPRHLFLPGRRCGATVLQPEPPGAAGTAGLLTGWPRLGGSSRPHRVGCRSLLGLSGLACPGPLRQRDAGVCTLLRSGAALLVLRAFVAPVLPVFTVMEPAEQVCVVIEPVGGVQHLVIVMPVIARRGFLLSPLAHYAQLLPAELDDLSQRLLEIHCSPFLRNPVTGMLLSGRRQEGASPVTPLMTRQRARQRTRANAPSGYSAPMTVKSWLRTTWCGQLTPM